MEQLTSFLAENMYITAAALYVLGVFLKAVPKIPNWVIPFVLTAAGVVFGMLILAGPAGCSRVSLPPAWPCSSIRAISRLRSRFLKLNRCKRAALSVFLGKGGLFCVGKKYSITLNTFSLILL